MTAQPYSDPSEKLPNLTVYLLQRRITCMTVPAIIEAIHKACVEDKKITVANYNVHSFNLSMQLPWFYNFLQSAEIAHCDGMGIIKALEYMGLDLPKQYRVSYTILMPKLLEHCDRHGLSMFLLGSKPENVKIALDRMSEEHPNIHISGHHGYFSIEDPQENEAVIEQINQAKPNILVLGMGMPKQEKWIWRHGSRVNVNVMMPGGAVVDRLAGIVSDCPDFISNRGLEWFYRLCREPKRLAARYLIGNPAFLFQMALGKIYAPPLKVQDMQLNLPSFTDKDSLNNKNWQFKDKTQTEFPRIVRMDSKRLGECLIEAGLLSETHVEIALSEQKATGMRLGEVIVRKGWLPKKTIEYLVKNVIHRDRSVAQQLLRMREPQEVQ